MPSQADREDERAKEDQAAKDDAKANKDAADGKTDAATKELEAAGKAWRGIAEDYWQKSQDPNRTKQEVRDYYCQAGTAWLRAAQDLERAAAAQAASDPAAADQLQAEANAAYQHAGNCFMNCGDTDVDRGDNGAARASYVQAETCFAFWRRGAKKLDPDDPDVERAEDWEKRARENRRKARKKLQESLNIALAQPPSGGAAERRGEAGNA